jgi:hypothetical protein
MKVATYEARVENGSIRLPENVRLPEKTRVYVIVPTGEIQAAAPLRSPRLVHPEQAADFVLEVIEETDDARL